MNASVRFALARFADCCLHSVGVTKEKCELGFKRVLKERKSNSNWKVSNVFAFLNLFLSSLALLYFGLSQKHKNGIRKPTKEPQRITFLINIALEWFFGFYLIFAYRKRDGILCQLWCVAETLIIVSFLIFTLAEVVYIVWTGVFLLVCLFIVKICGIWVIYYHSLLLKSDDNSIQDYFGEAGRKCNWEKDGMNISYLNKKVNRLASRRDTDATSIHSSPPISPPADSYKLPQENDYDEEVQITPKDIGEVGIGAEKERKISSMSQSSHFRFFADMDPIHRTDLMEIYGEQPRYSEIMIGFKQNINEPSSRSTFPNASMTIAKEPLEVHSPVSPPIGGTITMNKDLMCGGSSSIHCNFE